MEGKENIACSVGEGPVDASFKAINHIVQVPVAIVEQLTSTMEGTNAVASTQVVICERNKNLSVRNPPEEVNCCTFSGDGTHLDFVISNVQAYLAALNNMISFNDLYAKRHSDRRV